MTTSPDVDLLETALRWYAAGYSIIPIKPDGSKQPAIPWQAYQHEQPTADDVVNWGSSYPGMGVACGGLMALEMLEVEGYAIDTLPLARQLLADNGLGDVWQQIDTGYVERSPRGGIHWYYRVSDGPARGNTKLARRPGSKPRTVDVMWETRGQGGQSIIAPSAGPTSRDGAWTVLRGQVEDIPAITSEQRDMLHAVLSMLDEMPAAEPVEPMQPTQAGASGGLRPGDDFNARATWDDILIPAGWRRLRKMGSGWTWQRPGKGDPGISATTGQASDGVDRLYVFSTSTEFEAERPYSKFAAYALLTHGGDMSAAARALRAAGWGDRPQSHTVTASPGSHTQQPAPEAVTQSDAVEDALFAASPELGHIRQAARSRLISPWALLGAVLARCVAEVDTCVALPPTIGTRASLNLYVGIVGPSGAAKTTAAGVADDLLNIHYPRARVQGTGSGEGLIASYLQPDPDPERKGSYVLRDHPHVCVLVDEIGMLGSIQGRTGSTLAPVLRSGWSGAALETINADPTRKRIVPKMAYRLTVIAGIQPLAAHALFDDADTGTPQRWLWLPALDPHMPDEAPEWPGRLGWSAPDLRGHQNFGLVTVPIPDHVANGIREAHRARHRGQDTDHMGGHLTLTRLKVAAALAVLHGGYEITDPMWDLAGLVMDKSTAVRDECRNALSAEAEKAMQHRGRLDYVRDSGRRAAVAETTERDAKRLWQVVARHAGDELGGNRKHAADAGCTVRCVTWALQRRDPEQRETARSHALDIGWLVDDAGRLRLGSSQPAGVLA